MSTILKISSFLNVKIGKKSNIHMFMLGLMCDSSVFVEINLWEEGRGYSVFICVIVTYYVVRIIYQLHSTRQLMFVFFCDVHVNVYTRLPCYHSQSDTRACNTDVSYFVIVSQYYLANRDCATNTKTDTKILSFLRNN